MQLGLIIYVGFTTLAISLLVVVVRMSGIDKKFHDLDSDNKIGMCLLAVLFLLLFPLISSGILRFVIWMYSDVQNELNGVFIP